MKAYSTDLRQKIIAASQRGQTTQRAVAELFGVSVSFVEKLLQRYRTTGTFAAKAHGGGQKRRLDAEADQRILAWIQAQPDLTLTELQSKNALKNSVSASAVPRPLIKSGAGSETLGFDAKKKSVRATERDSERVRQARHHYRSEMGQISFERLTFVGESGVHLAMTRHYGRAPRGQRVSDSVPADPGVNVTMIGALSSTGLQGVDDDSRGDDGRGVSCLCRAHAGADVEAGRRGGDGQSACAQSCRCWRGDCRLRGCCCVLAAIFARPVADRGVLVEAQGLPPAPTGGGFAGCEGSHLGRHSMLRWHRLGKR